MRGKFAPKHNNYVRLPFEHVKFIVLSQINQKKQYLWEYKIKTIHNINKKTEIEFSSTLFSETRFSMWTTQTRI